MSKSHSRITRRGALIAVVTLMASLLAAPAHGDDDIDSPRASIPSDFVAQIAGDKVEAVYIVLMADDPVVAYDGDIQGLPATRPDPGDKVNPNSGAVRRYLRHLNSSHDRAIAAVGLTSDAKVYDYGISFNGFAAVMDGPTAARLVERDDVLFVWKDELRQVETDTSPDYLDLPGLWNASAIGGVESAGEGIIIGVIDTGIWPESPSFSDQIGNVTAPGNSGKNNLAYGPPPTDWFGICQVGELWSKDDCNNKLIGARYFRDGFSNLEIQFVGDYLSARDADGHGTHTASTAGGNQVDTVYPTGDATVISGMAPRARLAMYKACWSDDGCATSDLVQAIDTAVADGVDVINYSIGGPGQSINGPDDVAFLFADAAGVFVATSNGNGGPEPNTTGSPSSAPWVISVGAGNHGRNFMGPLELGDASTFSGAMLSDAIVTGELVDAEDHGNELCDPDMPFSPSVSGKIVLCARGIFARVAKSFAVAQDGGIGMIMYNPTPDSLNADPHSIPSVHVDHLDGPVIKAYIDAASSPTATLGPGGNVEFDIQAGVMAGFSSRGQGFSSDLIKPDILAPGVNVYAAAPPNTFFGSNPDGVQFLSGTSMSSPHIAGIGALIRQAHPGWSPAMVKSALMTTADPTGLLKEDQLTPADPFDVGSGLVSPGDAVDPGLVYDAGLLEYAAFTCGANGQVFGQGTCNALAGLGFSLEPSDLNVPSIAIGELILEQTVTRTVTNVGPAGTYEVTVNAPPGITTTVFPESLTLDAGESASYEVTFEVTGAATTGSFAFGSLTWEDGTHFVTSPIAVRPVYLEAPTEVSGTGTSGSLEYDVTFGYTGAFTAAPEGLFAANTQTGSVADDPANNINVALATCDFGSFPFACDGITWHEVTIGSGNAHARISLFDDYTDGADDLDLYVFDSSLNFVGSSGSPTSAEQVDIPAAPEDTYLVAVHGWETDGPDANYTLFAWDVTTTDLGNMTVVAPAAAAIATTETIAVDWIGLTAGQKYLGAVSYSDGAVFGRTLVSISTD